MRQMLGTLVALAALPVFGGLLLWFTSWMERRVEEPPAPRAGRARGPSA
jgi:hypothetical protein